MESLQADACVFTHSISLGQDFLKKSLRRKPRQTKEEPWRICISEETKVFWLWSSPPMSDRSKQFPVSVQFSFKVFCNKYRSKGSKQLFHKAKALVWHLVTGGLECEEIPADLHSFNSYWHAESLLWSSLSNCGMVQLVIDFLAFGLKYELFN